MTEPNWIKTIETNKCLENEGVAAAMVEGRRIALYAAQDGYYATDDICSHGQANLSDGYLEGYLIECPLHQGAFDIRTGAAARVPCVAPIRSYPVREDGGFLYVALS